MRLGRHCRAPPLAVQPSPAPTIRHGGEARRVGAGARRWADLQASVASTGPVCGQTNPGGRGEIVVGATQPPIREEPIRRERDDCRHLDHSLHTLLVRNKSRMICVFDSRKNKDSNSGVRQCVHVRPYL